MSSPPDPRDMVFGQFFEELEDAANRDAVIRRYGESYPHWAAIFVEEAGRGELIAPSDTAAAEVYPDRLPDFLIRRKIGQGGMGVVFEAWQESLGRRVALKIRRNELSPENRDRFEREQRVLARLHQTHIVPIHTAGQVGPWQYFAMAYIEGAALHHVVRRTLDHETAQARGQTPTLAALAKAELECSRNASTIRSAPPATAVRPPQPSDNGADSPTVPLRLSAAYFRSVAQVLADAGMALHYAHRAGVLHRDLKPSNVLVDTDGECCIIDFGLAWWEGANGLPAATTSAESGGLTRNAMGTPGYMAPEQWRNEKADARTDVWGLGVTLYELLALRPAFDGIDVRDRILTKEPPPLADRVRTVPVDLVAVCRKALRKDPAERYASAQEFGEDLRRWLEHEPTVAHPLRTIRRPWFWARRNLGWAATIAAALLAVVGLLATLLLLAKQEAAAAEDRALASERQVLVQRLQQLRLSSHQANWSADAWSMVRQLTKLGSGSELRNEAAATSAGLDARTEKLFDKLGASAVAFDATGQRLLLGGVDALPSHERPGEGAKVWDQQRDQILHVSNQSRDGPVAFRADGTPLQLIADSKNRHTVVLWDVAQDQVIRAFQIPHEGPIEPLTPHNHPEMVLALGGTVVAAAAARPDETATVMVWDAVSGAVIYQTVERTSTLAISPDCSLLALGDSAGQITIRSLPTGESLATLKAGRMPISCLAFERDRERKRPRRGGLSGWLLAAGDEGATITIWDCEAGASRSVCRGGYAQVRVVVFSPDGMTLASIGRGMVKLWDIATGRLLLDLPCTNWMTGVAFSLDGRRLASCGQMAFGQPGEVRVWHLETDRGTRTLRGLAVEVEKVTFSPDEQLLAAFSQDCRLAVWNLKTGTLLHAFEVPSVAWTDNAALAISPDNRQLAFAGSSVSRGQAVLWNLNTGKEEGNWTFSPGLNNVLAFHPSKKLLHLQVETRDGKRLPDSGVDVRENPPVLRARDLRGAEPRMPLFEIAEFNRFIAYPVASEDGSTFALVGFAGDDRARSRTVKAYAGLTGQEVWASQAETRHLRESQVHLSLDRSGRYLSIVRFNPDQATQVELPSGKLLGPLEPGMRGTSRWAPYMAFWHSDNRSEGRVRHAFIRRGERDPVLVLGIDVRPSGTQHEFSKSGTRFAWGSVDGTVNICDLNVIQRRLAELGLGW